MLLTGLYPDPRTAAMFETLIHLLHQLALNALSLILALLSGELPVNEPAPPSEPAAQRVELRLETLPQSPRFASCDLREARVSLLHERGRA